MFSSGPAPELNQPAHVQTLHLKPASVNWLGSGQWDLGSPLGPSPYLNSDFRAAHLDSEVLCFPHVEDCDRLFTCLVPEGSRGSPTGGFL